MQEKTNTNQGGLLPKIFFVLISALILGVLFFFGLITWYSSGYQGKIYEGVNVAGVSIGGLTKEEALQKLRAQLKYPTEAAFAFTYGSDTWHAIPEELGMQIQFDATVEKAWNIGRDGHPVDNLHTQLAAAIFEYRLEPVLLFDERVAFNFISSLAGYIDEPMEQPDITLHGSEVIINPGKNGKTVDKVTTMTQLHILGMNLQTATIELPVTVLEPDSASLETQKALFESLLSQDFQLYATVGGVQTVVDDVSSDMLAGWIDFKPIVEGNIVSIHMQPKRNPFYNRLVEIGTNLYRKPQNARFVFNDTTHIMEPISDAVVGQKIDIEASLENIATAIQNGQNQAEVVLTITEPEITASADGRALGVTELVESQYTYFYGSDQARVQNITAGAASFHGVLVAPGEIFSMADYIGDIDIDNGYAEAAVIFGNETIQGIGGGICQVSTTLFRAAFFYGLPIVERHQHAYRVFYYERIANGNIDPTLSGLDASVYIPLLDFKFKNDTPYWILMETYVNPAASTIQWKFYSTDVNRYVDWKTTGPTNVSEPESPLYRVNNALATGTVEQVDYEVKGADVTVNRVVYQDGAVHLQDVFETNYRPWQAIYEYGPGTAGMPPEKSN